MKNYKAYISKISDLPFDLNKGLDYIDYTKHVKKDSTVFVKPNFTYPYYNPGVTTTPELLGTLKDKADRVIVGESDGGNHSFTADQAFKGHNMYEICRETGAELINISTIPAEYIEEKVQGKTVGIHLPKLLLNDIDCTVSVLI